MPLQAAYGRCRAPGRLPAAIERIQDESKELPSRRRAFRTSWRSGRGRLAAARKSGVRLVADVLDGWDVAGLKSLAAAATAWRAASS